jgi:hypothetical protein
MLLITAFVELRVVAGRDRKRASRPHTVSGRPMLIHTCHAMRHAHAVLRRRHDKSPSERHGRIGSWTRHGRGMACVNQTRPHYVNEKGKTQSKHLVVRHGRGTAGARHGNDMGTAWYVWISSKGIRILHIAAQVIYCVLFFKHPVNARSIMLWNLKVGGGSLQNSSKHIKDKKH